MVVEFSYAGFRSFVNACKEKGYSFDKFTGPFREKSILMRRDVDFDLGLALDFAKVEAQEGITSTYFFLTKSSFYNLNSIESVRVLKEIESLGHTIGLHFDAEGVKLDNLVEEISREAAFIESLIGSKVLVVSFHRPARTPGNLDKGVVNISPFIDAYSMNSQGFKYSSDSNMERDHFDDLINPEKFPRIQFLFHPIWWGDVPLPRGERIKKFLSDRQEILEGEIKKALYWYGKEN